MRWGVSRFEKERETAAKKRQQPSIDEGFFFLESPSLFQLTFCAFFASFASFLAAFFASFSMSFPEEEEAEEAEAEATTEEARREESIVGGMR